MGALALRFRSLLIGVVCLLLSAGLVFAGGGFSFGAGSGGLDRAAEGPGQTVDDGDDADGEDSDAAPAVHDGDEDADNHGDLVSQAAQMDTPVPADGSEGFKNHGAFVSCVAKMAYGKKGVEAPTDFVLAELSPEDCDQAEEDATASADDGPGKSAQAKGKGHGKGKGNGRGR